MQNPYAQLKKEIATEQLSGINNPYRNLGGKDITGTTLEQKTEPTNFRRLSDAREQAAIAEEESKKANSFKTLAVKTVLGLPKATYDIAKETITNPKETAKNIALGLANGLSFGATDALQRKAFVDEAKKAGMDEEGARTLAESILRPEDPEQQAIRGGANFAGVVAPYALAEKAVYKGLAYAASSFVAKYAKTAKFLADIGIFNTIGQVEESFKPKDERNRGLRAVIDTGAAATFFLGGEIFRKIRNTKFQSPFTTAPQSAFNPENITKAREGIKSSEAFPIDAAIKDGSITREAVYQSPGSKVLTPGFAQGRIDDVAEKLDLYIPQLGEKYRKSIDVNNTTFEEIIKKGTAMLDDYTSSHAGLSSVAGGEMAGTKSAVTLTIKPGTMRGAEEKAIEKGAIEKTGEKATGGEITVATDNLESLQNYIKGSGEIDYKIVKGGLGKDVNGNTVMARHEFNPTTGKHTIYATSETTASQLSHELGHYFDKSLTQSTAGLSRLLPNFTQNREAIEDALGSYAVARLGGNATSSQISNEVKTIASSIISESKILSALRQGGEAQVKPSEAFADAVSQIISGGGSKEAPVLSGLLKHLDTVKSTELFGKSIEKELVGAKFATKEMVEGGQRVVKTTVVTPKITMKELSVPKELEGASTTIQKVEAKIQRIVNRVNDTEGGVTLVRNAESALSRQEANISAAVQGIREGGDKELAAKVGKFLNTRLEEARAGIKKFGDTISEKVAAVKEKGPGVVVEKEVAQKLERTPTGKIPKEPTNPDLETTPIKTEKITTDDATKKFFDEKILPQVTGKERIGKSNEDIITRSLSSKMTEKDFNNILSERFGNLSEDVVKAKRMMNDRALDIVDKVAGRDVADIPASELGEITAGMNQLVEMFEVMAGMRTELSNSFRSLGIAVAPGENDVLRQVVGEIQRVIGKDVSPFEITKKLVKLRESSIVDKYFTIWYPAILSGPKTTTRNIVGTGSSLVTDTLSQLFNKEGRLSFSERLSAMVGAQKQAWQNARSIFKGDQNIISKFHEAPPIKSESFKGKFAVLNKVEYVGRFLDAQDAFFSTIAREGEVVALRTGQYTYGLENKAIAEKINEGISQAFAQRITYRNTFENTAVGVIGRAATQLKASDNQFVKSFFTFIMPFVRTVANVTDRKLDYIPIINFARTFGNKLSSQRARAVVRNIGLNDLLLKDAMEGGMGRDEARKFVAGESERITSIIAERLKHQQMGKFYMGLTVAAGTVPLAMSGNITGAGPKDKNERDTLMQKGWRPNSLILPGGIVLPYNNLGPLAGLFSMAGNLGDAVKYGNVDEKGATNLFWSGIENFMRGELDQSFVSGIGGIYDALYGFKEFDQLLSEMATNAIPIPAAWNQTVSIVNPKQYEANGLIENIQRKLGITAGLEPKLNAFGEQYSADLIWGLTPKMLNTEDPVFNFMDENNVFVGKPQKATKIQGRNGQEREMTPEEYTKYLEATGSKIYQQLETKIRSGYFRRFKTEEEKKKAVSSIVSEIREQEKRKFKY